MSVKYRYSWKSLDNIDCRVDFYVKGAEPGLVILNPGEKPFILREFNSDQDFFKPIRPFIAEMEILSTNISMDSFLHNEDDGVQVQFFWNNTLFWSGWLMQDDFQEQWIDTNHFITLRATDGLGTIGSDPFPVATGQDAILNYVGTALNETALKFLTRYVVCNLFYDGQDDRNDGANDPLQTITVDGRTFQGENKDTVLNKIMRAWSMTTYQYFGKWFCARLAEWLTNLPIHGLYEQALLLDPNIPFEKEYDVNIGVDETIKPIMPEMLRSVRRPSKRTRINFLYKFPDEILCNQTFLRGSAIPPYANRFEVDCWTLKKGSLSFPTSPTASYYRKEDSDPAGNIIDNYLFIGASTTLHHVISEPIIYNVKDAIVISVEFRGQRNTFVGPLNKAVVAAKLTDGVDTYWLDTDGRWNTTQTVVTMFWSAAEDYGDWKNLTVESKAAPINGDLYIYLISPFTTQDSDANFKSLQIEIKEASKQPGVIGDYDQYTLSETIYNDFTEETFLDDSNNRQHKGALHFDNDLTGDNWYRMDEPTERLTFKRQKAFAHTFLNRRYRQKLEVNMLGNTWMDGATKKPIWLQNKFIFTDDAPGKKFMITNLSEMDFMNTTWKASLLEIWDADLDDGIEFPPHSYANIYEKDV